jgi:hypothetical protein
LNLKQVLRSTFPTREIQYYQRARANVCRATRASNYFAPRPPAATAADAFLRRRTLNLILMVLTKGQRNAQLGAAAPFSLQLGRCSGVSSFFLQFAFCERTGVEKWQLVGFKGNSLIKTTLPVIFNVNFEKVAILLQACQTYNSV